MPLPGKLVIVRALVFEAGENTTLLTVLPITKPLVPGAEPVPSRVTALSTATRLAAAIVMPASGVVPPTVPDSVIALPEESVRRLAPSTSDVRVMLPPAASDTAFCSVTPPANVCCP